MKKILTSEFFNRPVLNVAKGLLGKMLVRRIGKKEIAVMIIEVEAYDGQKDKACHASRGETPRNKVMFGDAGHWYVYFTYGMHWMLNIVTGPRGYPAAVLIRGIQILDKKNKPGKIVSGPARLTKYLKIDKQLYGSAANKKSDLWIEDRGIKIFPRRIKVGKRIGVDYAGVWAHKLWNFKIKNRANCPGF